MYISKLTHLLTNLPGIPRVDDGRQEWETKYVGVGTSSANPSTARPN